jgi:hypothetical protein
MLIQLPNSRRRLREILAGKAGSTEKGDLTLVN